MKDHLHYARSADPAQPACGAPKRKAPGYVPVAHRNAIGLPMTSAAALGNINEVTADRDAVTCGSCIRQGFGPGGRADL